MSAFEAVAVGLVVALVALPFVVFLGVWAEGGFPWQDGRPGETARRTAQAVLCHFTGHFAPRNVSIHCGKHVQSEDR
jgi:hypothetical protein